MPPEPALFTLKDFAAWSRLSRTTIWRQARAGRLRTLRIGGRTMIRVADAHAWLNSHPARGGQALEA
jgi:hypothetical protein